jgi:hypothetical protein
MRLFLRIVIIMAINFGIQQALGQGKVNSATDYFNQQRAANTTNQVNQTAIQSSKLDQASKQLDIMSNVSSALSQLPDDAAVNAQYQQQLPQLKSLFPGMPLPPTMTKAEATQTAQMAISAKDRLTYQASMYKSQGELALAGATLGLKSKENDINALKAQSDAIMSGSPLAGNFSQFTGQGVGGMPAQPSAGGVPMPAIGGFDTSRNMFGAATPPAAAPGMAPNPGQPGAAPMATPPGMGAMPGQATPSPVAGSGLSFPAEIESQKKQASYWQDFKNATTNAQQAYLQTKNVLNELENANKDRLGGGAAGFLPSAILSNTEKGRLLDKNSNFLQTNILKSLTASGISKLDIPIVNMIKGQAPSSTQYASVNQGIIDKFRAANEVVNNIGPKIVHKLDTMGVRDPIVVQKIINETIERTGLYNDKSGSIDASKLNGWEKQFDTVLKGQPAQNSAAPAQNSANSMPNLDPKAREGLKQQYGLNDAQLDQALKLQAQKQAQAQPQAQSMGVHPAILNDVVPRLAKSIGQVESGGNYRAIGPATASGDRAIGKYQIMSKNVPEWTKEVLGQAMTPQQFLMSPQAQDAVAHAKLAQSFTSIGNPGDAASKWFSGRPMNGNNSRDVTGTTVPRYVANVGTIYARL